MFILKTNVISLVVLWLCMAALSLAVGAVSVPLEDVVLTIISGNPKYDFVIMEYRMPRLIIASLVGCALALSGTLVQAVVRNPLASPDIFGVTAGAGLAVVCLLAFYDQSPHYWIPLAALMGGFSAAIVLLLIIRRIGFQPSRVALVGLALSAVCGSGIDYLLSTRPEEISGAMLWLTGSIWGRSWNHLSLILPWLVILVPIAIWLSYRLDLLSLGEEVATSLGEKVNRTQVSSMIVAVALASASVSVCGAISFVGLVAPHLARFLVGGRHFPVIFVAMLLGALLVVTADIVARTLAPPLEFPAGILVAMIGAPYFILLLTRYKSW